MTESKRDSIETSVNMCSGLVINNILTLLMFGVSPKVAFGTSLVFFCTSWCRSRLVRKLFRDRESKMSFHFKHQLEEDNARLKKEKGLNE